ncbi:MAG: thymidine phosphorylase family protein [Bacteroidetes bacterium]|nr:MAG: thymidine phosphorylase family protein [Bacteroidota bacterium]
MEHQSSELIFRRLGIHSQQEHFVYMREDCHVCSSEGFEALTRIRVNYKSRSIIASLNIIRTDILNPGEISLSESAIHSLGIRDGETLRVSHLHPIQSLSHVRSKIYGNKFSADELDEIITDIVDGNYSSIHLSAFITACAGHRLDTKEIISLTKAMISSGQQIHWNKDIIVDKHCIGGLPGNRTTPIVVSILTAFGLTMPKTSSRAITSPAGTADTMEVMTRVTLNMDEIKKVVEQENGCIVWGGTAQLSPADDILIRVEKALDIDSEGQLIASVLSKKASAGSNHVIIDMPIGETAKLRSIDSANKLKSEIEKVADVVGLKLKVLITDGTQPVGKGIGPVLEARDILSVLRNEKTAPQDLKERSLMLSAELLELSGKVAVGLGMTQAKLILESGKAYQKFVAICEAQGEFKEPQIKGHKRVISAGNSGKVIRIDNRKLAKVAKLAGAPFNKNSGIDFFSPIGKDVMKGQALYEIYAESKGSLEYALEYLHSQQDILTIQNH